MLTVIPFHTVLDEATNSTVANVIAGGGVIAIPTESSYALAASPFHTDALRALARAKGRPDGKPILVLIGAVDQVRMLAATVPPAADLLIRSFWPGPLTLVLPAQSTLSPLLTANTGTIGIRLPAYPLLRQLLVRVGPLTGTSANRSGQSSFCTAHEVSAELGEAVQILLDAGSTPGGKPSTVLDARTPVRVIREGAVSRAALSDVLHDAGYALSP
ncbi:MAG TPA: L-threonylcarbamoyladenylate synthase [Nitrospiraceae bacterium]|nr:L-threonylcarbamoyladenylate synthase [Nitrospiraceae bacterium]